MTALAENLRRARGLSGLSQGALATAASMSEKAVSDIERGQVVNPQAPTIARLAKALGTTVEVLRNGERREP